MLQSFPVRVHVIKKKHTEQGELFGNESAEVDISSYQNN